MLHLVIERAGFGKIDALSETVAFYACLGVLLPIVYLMLFGSDSFDEASSNLDDLGVWNAVVLWLFVGAAKWLVNERFRWLIYLSIDEIGVKSHKEVIKRVDQPKRYEDTISKVYLYNGKSS